jgi:hypothetical protein
VVSLPVQKYSYNKKFKFESFSDLRPASDTLLDKGAFSYKTISPSKKDYKSNLSKDLKSVISEGFKSSKFVQISDDSVESAGDWTKTAQTVYVIQKKKKSLQ